MAKQPSTTGCLSEFFSSASTVKKPVSILFAIFKLLHKLVNITDTFHPRHCRSETNKFHIGSLFKMQLFSCKKAI